MRLIARDSEATEGIFFFPLSCFYLTKKFAFQPHNKIVSKNSPKGKTIPTEVDYAEIRSGQLSRMPVFIHVVQDWEIEQVS